MAEYSRLAKGHFTSTGSAQLVKLPFQPDVVELHNYSSFATPANHGVPYAYWDASMGQGFAIEQVFNATPVLTTDSVIANGISSFSAGLLLQYGAKIAITGITKAAAGVVTTTSAHGLVSGNVVVFQNLYQTTSTGMQQIAGIPFVITVLSPTTFSIPWNTNQSNYTAISAGGVNSPTLMQVLYPNLYAPSVGYISSLTLASTTTVVCTAPPNFKVGQEVAFRIPSIWGTYQLNSLPNVLVPGSPIYGYVQSVTNSTTFVVNINSASYTAFNSNQVFASFPGEFFPQVVAVGDVNSGGDLYSGGALYPSPQLYDGSGLNQSSSINGPAIIGSYVNNTYQGFVVGGGAGVNDASSVLVGANGNVIYWRAFLHDLAVN